MMIPTQSVSYLDVALRSVAIRLPANSISTFVLPEARLHKDESVQDSSWDERIE